MQRRKKIFSTNNLKLRLTKDDSDMKAKYVENIP